MIELPTSQKSIQLIEQPSSANGTTHKTSAVWHEIQIKETPFEIPRPKIENEKDQVIDNVILTVKVNLLRSTTGMYGFEKGYIQTYSSVQL
ncbi:hypothetical protein H4Q26_000704 [Puccinia striiformis f. sp. tritici PST-130]|nr:hypothetical protein H4Q26_000704 [Puccinia striiformis f. sp. tritici PST-130]